MDILAILPELHFQIQIPRPHREILPAKPKQGLGALLLETSSGNSSTLGRKITASDPTKVTPLKLWHVGRPCGTMKMFTCVRRHEPSSKFHACPASTRSRLFLQVPFQAEPAGRKTAVSAHTGSMQIPSANGPETLLLKGSLN